MEYYVVMNLDISVEFVDITSISEGRKYQCNTQSTITCMHVSPTATIKDPVDVTNKYVHCLKTKRLEYIYWPPFHSRTVFSWMISIESAALSEDAACEGAFDLI